MFSSKKIEDTRSKVYIDPTYATNGSGSITDPKNTFVGLTLQSNTIYLLKRGTTYTSSSAILLSSLTNTKLDTYGDSEVKPSFEYTSIVYQGYAIRFNSCTSCVLNGWDITSTQICLAGVRVDSGSYNIINNCKIHDIPGNGTVDYSGMGIRGGGTSLRILNCEICYISTDGMYISTTTNLEIGYCNIHHVNQYYTVNSGQTYSSGDGIQLDGLWSNFYIHHNIIDRSDVNTGNKFCLILNSAAGTNDNSSGIVEYNTFMTNSNCPTQLYIEQGNGIITRYNIFKGVTAAVRVTGVTTKNNLIHHNIIYNSSYGVGVVYVNGSPLNTRVYNNVFYNLTGANCWIDDTTIDLKNNIFVGSNVQLKLYRTAAASYIMENNCYGTTTNIGTMGGGTDYVVGDPLFLDKLNYNFRLNENSICINAGKNVNITRDFDGNSIPQGVLPDIGAFEYI
jgi:hypothetical protein